jgi:hypothetical protein
VSVEDIGHVIKHRLSGSMAALRVADVYYIGLAVDTWETSKTFQSS